MNLPDNIEIIDNKLKSQSEHFLKNSTYIKYKCKQNYSLITKKLLEYKMSPLDTQSIQCVTEHVNNKIGEHTLLKIPSDLCESMFIRKSIFQSIFWIF